MHFSYIHVDYIECSKSVHFTNDNIMHINRYTCNMYTYTQKFIKIYDYLLLSCYSLAMDYIFFFFF